MRKAHLYVYSEEYRVFRTLSRFPLPISLEVNVRATPRHGAPSKPQKTSPLRNDDVIATITPKTR